ncbi:DUF4123 domain-containing protein [Polyangium spumosum]|uniref:DUF4123 domain-containing protein n=1 Tax=Polyangium spumosum TaxID=889282 RepID=A0A6N7Q0K8_9BACT|nr:DUF4123 domain-containing protein [Polyangium spumosum]MRG97347.1 DUF4123 domain-containing protein [Polyangium spumosum]
MQRAIVELRYGPEGGTKKVLSPGETLRVGRKAKAQWIVSDKHMSGVHFEVAYDGAKVLVRDLSKGTGTLVGGQKIAAAEELVHGGWIRAGETDFMVYLEAATPPDEDEMDVLLAAEPDELEPLEAQWVEENRARLLGDKRRRAARAAEALSLLRAVEGPLYVVLDAARTDRILTVVRESVDRYRSLYEGFDGEALEDVAPYLVEIDRSSSLLARLVEEGWGNRWGIFIVYPRSFKELRRHLRRFLMVADAETRKKYYFRFYDPVVLREFLPTCTPKQKAELFGEIRAFLVEDPFGHVARFPAEVS